MGPFRVFKLKWQGDVFVMKHVTLEGGIKVATFKKPPFDFNPFAAT